MTNPFEDPDAEYLVLVNAEGQHSLWPADITVPDGWTVRTGPADRAACLARIERLWPNLRPASVEAVLGAR